MEYDETDGWVVQCLEVPKDAAEAERMDAEARMDARAAENRLGVPEGEEEAKLEPVAKETLAKLEGMVIPVVSFDGTSLKEAIDFVRMRMMELDPEGMERGRSRISFVVRNPRGAEVEVYEKAEAEAGVAVPAEVAAKRMRYEGKNVRVLDLVREVARQCGVDAYATSAGVMLMPDGNKPKRAEVWKVVRVKDAEAAMEFLTTVKMPYVNFKETSAAEALDHLRARAQQREVAQGKWKGVIFGVHVHRWSDPVPQGFEGLQVSEEEMEKLPVITYSAEGPLFMDVLKEVARQAKLDVYLTTHGLVLRPAGQVGFRSEKVEAAKFVERIYKWEE
jgi:hypothetical protein